MDAFFGLPSVRRVFGCFGVFRAYPHLYGFDAAFILLEGPLLYLYIRLATAKVPKLRVWDLLHALPYVVFTSWLLVRIHSAGASDLYAHIQSLLAEETDGMIVAFGFFNHFHLIGYLFLSYVLLRRFRAQLTDEFSYTEGVNMKWLSSVVIGLMAVSAMILVGLIVSDALAFISHNTKAYLIYAVFSVLPFYLAFMAIRQQLVYPYEGLE